MADNDNKSTTPTPIIVISNNKPTKKYTESEMTEAANAGVVIGMLAGGVITGFLVAGICSIDNDRMRRSRDEAIDTRFRLENDLARSERKMREAIRKAEYVEAKQKREADRLRHRQALAALKDPEARRVYREIHDILGSSGMSLPISDLLDSSDHLRGI